MERTLRLEKERKEHKKEKAEDQHQQKWKRKGYDSILLPLPNSENIPPINNPGRNDDGCFGPYYVLGDVTQPKRLPNDNTDQALILSCIDNGGHFGTGGVFNALRAKSQRIVDEYELCCGRNDDLHLGDAMLIKDICENHDVQTNGDELGDCDDADRSGRSTVSIRPRKESVVLMIVQSHKNRKEISTQLLSKCFSRIAAYALSSGSVSIHLPRIGYGMRDLSWYVVDRLIRKHFTDLGINTYVYYFRRQENIGQNRSQQDSRNNSSERCKRTERRSRRLTRKRNSSGNSFVVDDDEEEGVESENSGRLSGKSVYDDDGGDDRSDEGSEELRTEDLEEQSPTVNDEGSDGSAVIDNSLLPTCSESITTHGPNVPLHREGSFRRNDV
ncbi:hypothetical protein AB6A40_007351 [Gnathostoma spinigerum]|uniref:Macro domain-containing protein n=1 Tax=Gnathostoma spinigerum TaxID=75299 RepID=A0ABD6EVC8_9BILA